MNPLLHRVPQFLRTCLLGFLMLPTALCAQSVTELTLQDVLSTTLSNAIDPNASLEASPYQASSWLAGLPSLNLSYLGSEDRFGVDESEVSINLPVKSSRRRTADNALQALSTGLDGVTQQLHSLYYSGRIREALWSYRLADAQRQFATRKRNVLAELEQRQQELLAAGSSSEYTLLLLQMEIVQVEVQQQDALQETRFWLERYTSLTGLRAMPADITEPAVPPQDDFRVDQHPQLQALELAYKQRQQVLRASSPQASDWNLALKAKHLDSDGYNEQQYGLGIEIPLSVFAVARQSENSEWRSAKREYLLARDQLLTEFSTSWERLLSERETLREKQLLLNRSQQLAGRINEQLAQLHDSNEIAQEIVLRRMMEAIDTRADVALNALLIEQNNAMLRQAAGISL
ncbi:Uncharacterised protein [Halioglobus japonicus]|nr:Uncharacterised protein [Halioglobus japonicus]